MKKQLIRAIAVMFLVTSFAALLGAAGARAAETQPFVVEWPRGEGARPAIDLSGLLEAPAGKHGFVRIVDGKLARGDGQRLRIWGINLSARGCLPPKEDAPVIADQLARLGINGIRFHFMDTVWALLDKSRNDTQAFDPAQIDKLDFFIDQLKKRGIYSNLNLNVARQYKPGDGVKDHELIGYGKSLTYFDPRIIELQKDYAKQLLTHKNPYTGNEYRSEPAVAIVELLNENSLIEAWFGGRLQGKNTQKNSGTWSDIPASYAEDLTKLYNQWLAKNVSKEELAKIRSAAGVAEGAMVPRLAPSEINKAPQDRFRAEARFYMSVERDFLLDMKRYLKEELGVKAPLVANSDHGHGKTGYPQVVAETLLDIVDSHVYWQHPSYVTDEKGKKTGFKIPNTAMVRDPLRSSVVQLSRSAVAGKPFTVSEANHPFPAEHASEGVPILAAYASLQDWDGIYWYTLAHDDQFASKKLPGGHFDFCPDPVKMSQLAAGAMMFLRGDVKSAQTTIERTYTREQVMDSIRLSSKEAPYFTPGFPLALPLMHAVRTKSFDGPPTGSFEGPANANPPMAPIVSDTKELAWDTSRAGTEMVTVDTEKSQAAIGFLGGRELALKNLGISAMETPFGAITLSAMDGRPIASSSRLLLTAGSRMENTGQKWNEKRTTLETWGKSPTRIEVVKGLITLSNFGGAKGIKVTALDGGGRPLADAKVTAKPGKAVGAWEIPLGSAVTTWYAIEVER